MKNIILIFFAVLLLAGCSAKEPSPVKQPSTEYYERKPGSSDRKAGPGMMLMEQAEIDAEPSADLIVIPPDPDKKKTPKK